MGLLPISTGHLSALRFGHERRSGIGAPCARVYTEKSIRIESDRETNARTGSAYGRSIWNEQNRLSCLAAVDRRAESSRNLPARIETIHRVEERGHATRVYR